MTVLFTDVVDSTTLYDRFGADATDELRRSQFAVLRTALAGHNGTEVKSTGDGLMVAFASAIDAGACAVSMQRALAQLRRADHRLPATRIGISAGEATREGDDWYGAPIVEAARLCQSAEGDQILCSAIVSMLVGTRGDLDFVDLGTRDLKGFTTPVGVKEIRWAPDSAAVPLPYAVTGATTGPFVGRIDAVARLADAWERGDGLLLIGGEPGIGKTRVLAELAARVHAEGGVVLWGRCDEDLAMAYQPFVEGLRHYIDHAPDDELARIVPASDLLRLVPELKERLPDLEPPTMAEPDLERLRMFEAVVDLLAGASRTAPILLVLDDLHWATTPTLLLLRYLTRPGLQPPGVLIAATYRDTELDRAHPLAKVLADLRRQTEVERVSLSGLGLDDVTAFVDATGGDAALAAAVYEETEGNPFFVGEMLRHLAESVHEEGADEIPEGVRDVIGRRLSRLSGSTNRILAVASAIGPEVDLGVLELIPDAADAGSVLDALEEAARAKLLTELPKPVGRFAFTHALVRQTLYAELSVARRARIHFRIAEAMESLPAPRSAVLAHHYAQGAAAGGLSKAVTWTERAARDAARRLAFEEAAALYERALQLLDLTDSPAPAERMRLLMSVAVSLRESADIEGCRSRSLEVAALAREVGDVKALAFAAVLRSDWGLAGFVDDTSENLLLEAIEAVGESDLGLKTELLGVLAFYRAIYLGLGWHVDPLAQEAIGVARRSGDEIVLARALAYRAYVLQGMPDLDTQHSVLDELGTVVARLPGDVLDWVTGEPQRDFVALAYLRHWPIVSLQEGDIAGFDRGLTELARAGGIQDVLVGHHRDLPHVGSDASADRRPPGRCRGVEQPHSRDHRRHQLFQHLGRADVRHQPAAGDPGRGQAAVRRRRCGNAGNRGTARLGRACRSRDRRRRHGA